VRADGEVVAGEREGKIREAVTLVTLNRVLSVEGLLGTNLLVPIQLLADDPCYVPSSTYRSSARVEGRAMSEVPVSSITPVLSSSAVSSPKVMASRSTSQ
jgi:hypothetical protein